MRNRILSGDLEFDRFFWEVDEETSPVYQLLRQMEELSCRHRKLKQESDARKSVLRLTTHDLMSPLNAIKGYLDLMKFCLNTNADLEQLAGYRSKIKSGVEDISSILQQVREMGKQDEYEDYIALDVDLNWVVRDVCDVMEGAALAKEHKLECIQTSQPVYVSADLSRLKRILFNLITNSIKYTSRGGEITVSVENNDAEARIIVADNGLGIPRESFKDIFRPDKKLHLCGTENESSSGLGLYISTHFAAQMNGRITLESEVEEGSRFSLHLPLSSSESSQNF
ncbi:HAMP domain-containing sensor histidine kinase [Balneolales bacterium ANBcel1]|nr:HAMP domain-containing sensor histidine kinase [Balneolales bacterium ANBcel1]